MSLWHKEVANLARKYGPLVVWRAGERVLGYPPVLAEREYEFHKIRAELENTRGAH